MVRVQATELSCEQDQLSDMREERAGGYTKDYSQHDEQCCDRHSAIAFYLAYAIDAQRGANPTPVRAVGLSAELS